MKVSETKASNIAKNKMKNDKRIKNILEKYNDRVSFGSQRTREDITMYRTGLYISDPIDLSKGCDTAGGGKVLDYIAYCDVSFETGECLDIVFMDSFKEFE